MGAVVCIPAGFGRPLAVPIPHPPDDPPVQHSVVLGGPGPAWLRHHVFGLPSTALRHQEMARRGPLIGILPHRQLDLERVQTHGTERGHLGPIGPTQDQQIAIAFHAVAEGQDESVVPARLAVPAVSHRHRGRFAGRYPPPSPTRGASKAPYPRPRTAPPGPSSRGGRRSSPPRPRDPYRPVCHRPAAALPCPCGLRAIPRVCTPIRKRR